MNFGNASWGFRETELKDQLRITSEMGLDILELGIANAPKDLPLDVSESELDNVKKLYEHYKVKLICAATGNDFSCGSSEDVRKIKKVIDICSYLGVKYLRIFAGFSPVDEVDKGRWDIMIDCIGKCAEYADTKDVVLTVETHGGVNGFDDGVEHFHSVSSKPEILYKMLDELSKDIKINFDPANLWAVGEKNPEKIYENIKERVAVVHLKDFVTLPSGHLKPAACGESDMDWKKILTALKDFEGPMLFEYEIPDDIEEGSTKCYRYIDSMVKEVR